jgi:serine/threonine protein kinase
MGESNLQDRLTQGACLDQYVLLERIGVGGQAAVWSAWDEPNSRVVAIKVILSSESETAALPQTAMREAQLVASLTHPNILPLYDFKFSDQMHYLVMRYICGGTLKDLLNGGPQSVSTVLRLTEQLTSALTHLHERGVVHRDLKPSNILFDSQGRVYLTDFGLARDLSEIAFQLHTGRGTPPYAPPEQHTYASITPQSDIYSLGVMLYEMFTGSLPWGGGLSLATRQIHGQEEMPDPRAVNPQLPKALVGALRIITSADPAERPATASDVMWLLRQVFEGWQTDEIIEPAQAVVELGKDDKSLIAQDANTLVQRALASWQQDGETYQLGLSQFRLIDSVYTHAGSYGLAADDAIHQFLLYGALAHGHNLEHWSAQIQDQELKRRVCEEIILRGEAPAAERAINLLLSDSTNDLQSTALREVVTSRLIDLALDTQREPLSTRAFSLICNGVPATPPWQAAGLIEETDRRLGQAALVRGKAAQRAAGIIGCHRNTAAVQTILAERQRYRQELVVNALLRIHEVAGSLPGTVPFDLRAQTIVAAIRRQLLENPLHLIKAYLSIMLGGLLGFGAYVYLTYQLPQFLDTTRVLVALEHGFFLGITVGFGLFCVRLIVERMQTLGRAFGLMTAVLVGTLIINLSLVLYHTLFLGVPPTGWLIAAGSFTLAALTALSASLPVFYTRMPLTALGVFSALWGGWQLHLLNNLDPILWFDYNWTDQHILMTVLLTSIILAIFVNAVGLRRKTAQIELNTP